MLYAILIYGSEAVVEGWSPAEDEALAARHFAVRGELAPSGRIGPAFRLMPTTTAVTVRNGVRQLVLDGPFAETKEQLLGLWTVECETLDEVVAVTRRLDFESAVFEIRPVRSIQTARAA